MKLLTRNLDYKLDKMSPTIQKHNKHSIQEHRQSRVEHQFQDLKLQINMNYII